MTIYSRRPNRPKNIVILLREAQNKAMMQRRQRSQFFEDWWRLEYSVLIPTWFWALFSSSVCVLWDSSLHGCLPLGVSISSYDSFLHSCFVVTVLADLCHIQYVFSKIAYSHSLVCFTFAIRLLNLCFRIFLIVLTGFKRINKGRRAFCHASLEGL